MAESWEDYFYGSPAQRAEEQAARQRAYDEVLASKRYQQLRRDPVLHDSRRSYDPREIRANMLADTLHPANSSEYLQDLQETPGRAYSAVFETTMRPRDTLIKAAQSATAGDWKRAAMLSFRAPLSMVYPPAAAGVPGSPDDWRNDARDLGVGEANILALDALTDPETYLAVPLPFKALGAAGRVAGRGAQALRYGGGIPTHLVDQAGNVIRTLKNAQPMPASYGNLRLGE